MTKNSEEYNKKIAALKKQLDDKDITQKQFDTMAAQLDEECVTKENYDKKMKSLKESFAKGDLTEADYKKKKEELEAAKDDLNEEEVVDENASTDENNGGEDGEVNLDESGDETFDYTADLNVLMEEDASLSDEFKLKAKTIFDSAIRTAINERKTLLEEEYENRLTEKVLETREQLESAIDGFLTEAVNEWITENKVKVDAQLKVELTEGVLDQLRQIFVEHYIDVPESRRDILEDADKKIVNLEESVANFEKTVTELTEENNAMKREKIINEASADLSATQREKVNVLLEDVLFEDAEEFKKKVQTTIDVFFKGNNVTVEDGTEIIEEDVDPDAEKPAKNKKMQQYINVARKMS